MKIWLLTHSEELKKASGTGKLVKAQLGCDCEVVVWSRTEPDPSLTQLPVDNTVLVYLNNDTQPEQQKESARLAHNIIIIDSTWQQANKIYNRSPYLHRFQRYQIHDECSSYSKGVTK